ncbi:MAG: type VI secretion system contractile sheath large subunit, partial [Pyrinomonadaceae bacterium]
MATSKSAPQGTTTTDVTESLLDEAISATKQTSADRTEQLLRILTSEALKGTVSYNRNLSVTINN